jgi:hypothetical protein
MAFCTIREMLARAVAVKLKLWKRTGSGKATTEMIKAEPNASQLF